ncbi:MAG: hypothetical protein K1X64_09275 [Myxococcaceae bacterium]|nr:hypothetical protein [Myxococcaceae bacterium]
MLRSTRFAVIAMLVSLSAPAFASVIIAHTFEQLVDRTPIVIQGRVGQVDVRIDDSLGHIYTYAEILVDQTFKGRAPKILVVRQPGGEWSGRRETVAGAARFTPGEGVILFIEPAADDPSLYVSVALAAGKVSLEKNARGQWVGRRYLDGLSFVAPSKGNGGNAEPVIPGPLVEQLGTLDDIVARIRQAVAKRGAP